MATPTDLEDSFANLTRMFHDARKRVVEDIVTTGRQHEQTLSLHQFLNVIESVYLVTEIARGAVHITDPGIADAVTRLATEEEG